jgi:hypothetical protein
MVQSEAGHYSKMWSSRNKTFAPQIYYGSCLAEELHALAIGEELRDHSGAVSSIAGSLVLIVTDLLALAAISQARDSAIRVEPSKHAKIFGPLAWFLLAAGEILRL